MKYTFIQQQQQRIPVSLWCRVLGVSVTGCYAWKTRPPSARSQQDTALTQHIQQTFETFGGRYGSPRVYHELRAAGHCPSRKRVARLMKRAELRARARRPRIKTTDSNHENPIAPNVLARQFAPLRFLRSIALWQVTSLTFQQLRAGCIWPL